MGMLRVRHEATSAAEVRHAIVADLHERELTRDSLDDVALVVSELVGNAVTHVVDSGDLDVEWQLSDVGEHSFVLVRVQDSSTERPQLQRVDTTSTNGRGLAIVAALATDWGVRELAHGKQVWAQVPVRRVL